MRLPDGSVWSTDPVTACADGAGAAMTTKVLCGVVAVVLGIVVACAMGSAIVVGGVAAACSQAVLGSPSAAGTFSVSSPTSPEDPEECVDACPQGSGSSAMAGCEAGTAVLARAATWLTAWNGGPIPYLSSTDPSTWFDGYRRDCSGYASMALGLPGPGLDTAGLAARYTPIAKEQLQPGDLLINPAPNTAGHVVIFDHWADTTMTSYVGYEQSGDGGTHHRPIPYPYFGDYWMQPLTASVSR